MSFFTLSVAPFVIVLSGIEFMNLSDNILMEYILVKLTKKKNKAADEEEDENATNNELPFFYGFRALGDVLGTFFGGRIIEVFGNQSSFKVALAGPVILIFFLFLYDETPENPDLKPKKNLSRDWKLIKQLLSR